MNAPSSIWRSIEPGKLDYREALDLQYRIATAKMADRSVADILILLEHPPVFTMGRRGGIENLTVTKAFLKSHSIPIVATDRGGNITYHGPGQLVVYPIIDLAADSISVAAYVEKLETVMMRTIEDWGIEGYRDPSRRGVWVDGRKIGSVGIAVRRSVCLHGFALNVDLSLEPFSWINPCGIEHVQMTSIQRELSQPVNMAAVTDAVKQHTGDVFGVGIKLLSTEMLTDILNRDRAVA